jgi:hypothetical protein
MVGGGGEGGSDTVSPTVYVSERGANWPTIRILEWTDDLLGFEKGYLTYVQRACVREDHILIFFSKVLIIHVNNK